MSRKKRIDYQPDDGDFALLVELAAEFQRLREQGHLYAAARVALRLDATAGRVADDAVVAMDQHTPGQRRQLARDAGPGFSRTAIDNRVKRARARRDTDHDDQIDDNEEEN